MDKISVILGIIFNHERDSILLAKRAPDKHMGEYYEFPGGKIEKNESNLAALKRELHEELGIHVNTARRLIKYDFQYDDRTVNLDCWLIENWQGSPRGKEQQQIYWVPASEIDCVNFPPANRALLTALKIPQLYLISPDLLNYDETFLKKSEELLRNGVRLFQFRSKKSEYSVHTKIISQLIDLCNKYSACLILNNSPEIILESGAHGIHLSSAALMQLESRPLSKNLLVGASCHNFIELEKAHKIDADFCVISPVNKTLNHPEAQPMGIKKFTELVNRSVIPAYALGGMQSSDMQQVLGIGAQGLAMISGIWDATNPEQAVQECNKFNVW